MEVLVVEDEESVASGIRRALESEGFVVEVVADGATGLSLARERRFDVIILDLMLPKLNGYRVCRTLRAEGTRTPIIILSAKSGQWDIVEGLDIGADDYLTKPFSMAVLLARVRARARGAGISSETLAHGGLRLDTTLRRCWRGETEIELTSRETTLLRELFRSGSEVIVKDELLERVWGADFAGDSNVVEVYIGRLRRKVDTPFGTNAIETIRGVGYRMSAPTPEGLTTRARR